MHISKYLIYVNRKTNTKLFFHNIYLTSKCNLQLDLSLMLWSLLKHHTRRDAFQSMQKTKFVILGYFRIPVTIAGNVWGVRLFSFESFQSPAEWVQMVYYCRALFLTQINDANFTSHNCIFVFVNVCIVIPTSAISLIFWKYIARYNVIVHINTIKNKSIKHIS